MRAGVDVVVLDVGGVLLLPDPHAFREQLEVFGISPSDDECAHAHYTGIAAFDELGQGDYTHADRAIARYFGVPDEHLDAAATAIDAVYARRFVPAAGVADQLRRLRAAGVALAVVSNATGAIEAMLAEHGICAVAGAPTTEELPEVAVVVDSHVVGIEKPNPAIFSLAMDVLGVAPERCVYVGDSVHFDVNGATAAGLLPVHVTPLTRCAGEHPHYPTLARFVDAFLGE